MDRAEIAPVTPVEALLLSILAAIKENTAAVRDLSVRKGSPAGDHRSVLTRADLGLLGRLLPAIAGALGSEPFLARDLFESAAVRLVVSGLNTRQVGRLLRRAEGHAIDGYLIERVTVELGAILWRVVQAPTFLGNEKVSVPPRVPR
jgi:hypothetical protein